MWLMPFVKMVTKEGEFTPVQLGVPTMIVEILEMQTYRFIRNNGISLRWWNPGFLCQEDQSKQQINYKENTNINNNKQQKPLWS